MYLVIRTCNNISIVLSVLIMHNTSGRKIHIRIMITKSLIKLVTLNVLIDLMSLSLYTCKAQKKI